MVELTGGILIERGIVNLIGAVWFPKTYAFCHAVGL